MTQAYQMPPFDVAKYKISDSSKKLYKYTIWMIFAVIALIVLAAIAIFVIIGISIDDLMAIDPDNIYEFADALLAGGAVAIVLILIGALAVVVIQIMIFVQYYKLGSGYSLLSKIDPSTVSLQYASYGIYGYIAAIIIGLFVPNTAGSIISILSYVSLAVGFFFIYRSFVDYRGVGRFNKKPTMLLFIGAAISAITQLTSMFTVFGSFGSIIGFILLLLGFRELGSDIMIVQPPSGQAGPYADAPKVEPLETHPAKPAPSDPIPKAPVPHEVAEARYCANCGAKQPVNVKFCQNCGESL